MMDLNIVTAEWALFGNDDLDRTYRILTTSRGTTPSNESQIARWVGFGSTLPSRRASASWFLEERPRRFVFIIRDSSAQLDVSGRPSVRFRFFFLPFDEIAPVAVTSGALYAVFRGISLPPAWRSGPGSPHLH